MRISIALIFLSLVFLFVSCSKNADQQLPVNPPADSGTYVISGIYEEYYDNPGGLMDSSTTRLTYDKSEHSLTFSSFYGTDNDTWKFIYDDNGNWLTNIYTISGVNAVRQFTRDANGQATQFDYDFYGTHYTALFQYETLPGNIKRTTVIDTIYTAYTRYGYTKADEDATGKIIRLEYLPWGSENEHEIVRFYYDADGQMTYTLDSLTYDELDGYITKAEFTRDEHPDTLINDFTKGLKGKNFWWFTHDKDYFQNYFYTDFYYVGKPLKEVKESSSTYLIGNPPGPFVPSSTTTVQNTFDANNHLAEAVVKKDGVIYGRFKFWYAKVK